MSPEDTAREALQQADRAIIDADEVLLRASTVSRRLSVNVSTVRRWVIAKKMAAIILPGGSYRIPASEVERVRATLTHVK